MNTENIIQFRHSLLDLHKALMEYQKKVYEGQNGKILSPNVLFGLLIDNPGFAWLRQISELVVSMDELLESKEPVEDQKFLDLIAYAEDLLNPASSATQFAKNYLVAIKQDPAAALIHGKLHGLILKISAS